MMKYWGIYFPSFVLESNITSLCLKQPTAPYFHAMAKRTVILFLWLLAACNTVDTIPNTFQGLVIGVKDGDTIEVYYNGEAQTVRLLGVDCPEKKQAFGTRAKLFTSAMCFGKTVTVESNSKLDRYQRILGTVFVDSKNLNAELVKAGMAWHYKHYSNDKNLSDLEEEAKQSKAGLWVDEEPIAPWEYRKAKRNGVSI
jgi:micrococcal nuclease